MLTKTTHSSNVIDHPWPSRHNDIMPSYSPDTSQRSSTKLSVLSSSDWVAQESWIRWRIHCQTGLIDQQLRQLTVLELGFSFTLFTAGVRQWQNRLKPTCDTRSLYCRSSDETHLQDFGSVNINLNPMTTFGRKCIRITTLRFDDSIGVKTWQNDRKHVKHCDSTNLSFLFFWSVCIYVLC